MANILVTFTRKHSSFEERVRDCIFGERFGTIKNFGNDNCGNFNCSLSYSYVLLFPLFIA